MKNKLQQFSVKLLAATLAVIMAVPADVFAMNLKEDNSYAADTSVMGIQTQEDTTNTADSTDSSLIKSSLSTEETTDYIIEKSARLSKTTGDVDYKIVVKAKNPSTEPTGEQTTTFGITENTDDEKLSVDDVKALDANGNETDINFNQHTPNLLNTKENIRTTGITSAKPQYGMVYYLSTKLTEEALKNLEENSPQLALDITIASPNQDLVQTRYSLKTIKADYSEVTIDNDGNVVNQTENLVEKEDNLHLYRGEYKSEEKTIFQTTPAQLVWTDYINAKDDKEFAINFDLDENQDTENSQIKIDYYEARDKGYVLNQSFSKTVDFTNSLNLTIPQGYIAKLEVITKPKENTNAKEYEFNGIKIQNPSYTEEISQAGEEKKSSEDDADPLPADTSKEEKSKTKEEDERQKTEESGKSAQSAIALNKDAYISDLKENNKLSTNLENATKQIVPVLESYNKEEINWDDFKASIQNIAKAENIDSAQAEEIISALLTGLNEDKYKVANVDIKEATNFDQASEKALTTEEIKALIKSEFSKEKSGQITEEELEASLASIREENNITNEDFFNILRDLYKNAEIANDSQEDTTTIKTDKTKEEVLAEKLAEENLSTEDFITFLKSYVKSYDIKEDQLESLLKDKQAEVEKVIGDFTIDEIVAAAYLEGLNPHIFAAADANVIDSGISNEDFKTELEYYTETLTRATNEEKFFEIVKSNSTDDLSDQQIRNDYVGWKISIPGIDDSDNDITEFKKDKYKYDNLNFSIYAPAGQSLEDYQVVVEDGQDGSTTYSGEMTEKKGEHYLYNFSIPRTELTEKGYNIYVVAKAPKKRQNYAIGLKVSPDKNYVNTLVKEYENKFEEFKEKYPLLIKWIDTSDANPYRNGINLIDTRMVYLEPNGWQDLFPYNGFRSLDYNDNIDDTDIMKNRVSMFGNITEEGQITWTISETFPAEKLVNKNTVGIDAYSAKTDGQVLTGPSVQILVPNDNGGYDVNYSADSVDITTLQNNIGSIPGTIVNYTYKDQATNKEKFTTLSLDSGKSASIAYKPSLLQREEGAEKDTTGLAYLHKVQEHKDGPGYEVALANDQANTMKAFIPSNPSANPRYKDPNFIDTGVLVFCLNPGKPEPTRQYKFNGTITKGEWSTKKDDWAKNGRAIAALATANEAKSSPLYKGQSDDTFYKSLYEYLLRMYWYGQEIAEEYQLDEQSYYKIIQYNLYYWLAGENYAENFRNGGGYNPNYFSSAEYSYATGLKNRIEKGKDWENVDYDEEIQFFYYGHDKTRSYQNTITGDTKRKSKKGSVTVNKIDQDGKKLPGAYFQLLDAEQNPIKTLVTDENGVAIFDDLDYGTYYIKEVQGPKGYQFKEEISKAIVVGKTQAHYTFNYKNKKNEIEFRKVNEKGLAMDGVVFELSLNGRALSGQDQISGKDGKFSWKELTPGNYQVVEKDISKYPKYSENQGRTVASFRVDENNNIKDKKIYYPKGSSPTDIVNKKNEGKPIGIEFTKVDLKTENPLEGAEFVLEYRKPDSSIFRELSGSRTRSNSQGKLVWNDLVDGDYRVIETKAPDGNYDTELNLGEKATFTIVRNENNYYEIKNVTPSDLKITNTEKPEEPKDVFGEFEFTKVDSETKDKLQGVEFTLTSNDPVGPENDKFDYKVSKTTGEDGKIKYTKLYPGTYTLKETKQLPGYKENTKTWTVVVDSQGETNVQAEGVLVYTMTVKPIRQIAAISIHPNSDLIKDNLTSSGIAYITNLEVGKEKKFSKTFSIKDIDKIEKNNFINPINQVMILEDASGNQRTASIFPKFKVIENSGPLTITNDKEKPEPANLTIKKVDSQTKEGLEGAKFELYRTKENAMSRTGIVDYATTNEHGYAVFDSPEIAGDTTYYVKEIAAPDGYKITSAITAVKSSATEDNKINAEIANDKNNARFELYKKGDDGEYLEGVKFKLTNKTTNQSVELTTDGNGYISYDKLETNTSYEIEETKSAQGYTLNNAKATITVDDSGNVTVDTNDLAIAKEGENQGLVLVATNIKQASIDFVKQDLASKKALYGAEFVLYKVLENGESMVENSLTSSDKEGKFGFDNLEDGSYTVYETVSPEGYPYLEDKLEVASFTVENGKVTKLTTNPDFGNTRKENPDMDQIYVIYNKVNEIKFKKVNEDNEVLKGAKFKLDRVWDSYDDNGKLQSHRDTVLKDIETLDDGIIALSATEPGRYQLIETSAPEGYQQVNTDNDEKGEIVAEFTVERGSLDIKNVLVGNTYIQDMKNDTGDLEIVNKKEGKGKFQVNKVEKDGTTTKPLTGARFLLRDIDSDQYVNTDGTLTTNSAIALTEGSTVNYENLPVGEYELREFKSPDGYVRTINTWKIVVARYGKTTITKNEELDNDVTAEITPEATSSPAILELVNKSNEIEFTKIDSNTEDPLKDVEFEVWWDQQGSIENRYEDTGDTKESQYKNYVKIKNPDGGTTFTTDSKGKFKLSNLKTGHYKIYETLPKDYKVTDQLTDNEPIKDAKGEFVNEFFVDIDGDIKKNDNGIVGGKDDVLVTTIKNTPITGKFRVQKVDEDGVEKLDGAEFELYKVTDGKADKENPINQEVVKDSDGNKIPGRIEFADLEEGQYLLEETKAPDGYVMSTTKWEVTVSIDGKINISSDDESSYFTRTDDTLTLNVVNKKPTYPSTGGNGAFIGFAIIGTAVMLAGIAYFAIYQNDKNRRRSDRYGR